MLVGKTDILKYVPQQPPMTMVDSLLFNDDVKTTSRLQIPPNNIFCDDGYFTEAGLIENMAQTAALKDGYEASLKNEKVKVGYIGAVKNLKIYKLPKVDSIIETTITITNNFGNIKRIEGEVICEGEIMAESVMSIFIQEEN